MTYLTVRILVPARRDVAGWRWSSGYPSSTTGMLIAPEYRRGWASRMGNSRGTMKIYLLMALISAIAAVSHLKLEPKEPEREA